MYVYSYPQTGNKTAQTVVKQNGYAIVATGGELMSATAYLNEIPIAASRYYENGGYHLYDYSFVILKKGDVVRCEISDAKPGKTTRDDSRCLFYFLPY